MSAGILYERKGNPYNLARKCGKFFSVGEEICNFSATAVHWELEKREELRNVRIARIERVVGTAGKQISGPQKTSFWGMKEVVAEIVGALVLLFHSSPDSGKDARDGNLLGQSKSRCADPGLN